jgi:DNA-binding MarR family transcriptional regulator
MNKTVELVKMWGEFEIMNPQASIEDFCRHTLIEVLNNKSKSVRTKKKQQPPRKDIIAMKYIKRISWLYSFYVNKAKQQLSIKKEEEFFFLNYIYQHENPRKTDVIYEYMQELTTGLSILDGLRSQGWINEVDDVEDKRSKRLLITAEGQKVLKACIEKFARVNEILFKDVSREDLLFLIELLQPIDDKFSILWKAHRSKSFAEAYLEVTGRQEMDVYQDH